jgi:cob(I)alamin adenosyltransferase
MGTVDELCSVVGVVHAEIIHHTDVPEELNVLQEWLLDVMSRLFDIGSHVAKPRKVIVHNDSDSDDDDDNDNDNDKKIEQEEFTADGVGNGFDINHIDVLEEWIDRMTEELPELTHFILPTGTKTSAQLHVARCVCRRAERRLLPLVKDGVCDPNAGKYLNRLSDFFFTAARWSNFCEGLDEVQYKRPMRGARQRNRVTVKLREEKKVL